MIFQIFISGFHGGKIVVDGDYPNPNDEDSIGNVPPGTCAIQWHDPAAWYWAKDNKIVNTLPSSALYDDNDGDKILFFSGPYGGCSSSDYSFPFPLTENDEAPFELADSLVVQIRHLRNIKVL